MIQLLLAQEWVDSTAAIFAKRVKSIGPRKTLYAWWFYMFSSVKLRMGCGNTLYRKMQRRDQPVKKLFDYITDAELKWADMGEYMIA
jgi:hypothetical protein